MHRFRRAVRHLLWAASGPASPAGGREACRAFLERLSWEPGAPERENARRKLQGLEGDGNGLALCRFLDEASVAVEQEVEAALAVDRAFQDRLQALASRLGDLNGKGAAPLELAESYWAVFVPEAVGVIGRWSERIRELRAQRTVKIDALCPAPIRHPAEEILWTSNVLLTVPAESSGGRPSQIDPDIRRRLDATDVGEQAFWYDHPVPIGMSPRNNEIVHGLRGLSEMLAFEKERGTARPEDRLDVVLSVSVTHRGLHQVARPYIESMVKRATNVHTLNIYIFTEEDTRRLLEGFLCPAARAFGLPGADPAFFGDIFGVDGPYGRHYNFLKAVSAIWQIVKKPGVKATFKIDLDQVFPQQRLVEEVGRSAFELLTTPLWGAKGRDYQGDPVELGMIAGALVNGSDIGQGLFTPDVKLPGPPFPAYRLVFATPIPQALSTAAGMMARYGGGSLDGERNCLSRVHVTGGTTGIRIDALRRYRPFTLSRISRAEDQAYIMSVLHEAGPRRLRYAHVPGLIMRHDKHSFAAEAIRAAAPGKAVGDFERMILFSAYARALPWPVDKTRSSLAPFTGSFVHPRPLTTALTAFALRALEEKEPFDVHEFLTVGARKLSPLLRQLRQAADGLRAVYERERVAWRVYYDLLDHLARELESGSEEARRLVAQGRAIVNATRVHTD